MKLSKEIMLKLCKQIDNNYKGQNINVKIVMLIKLIESYD